MYASLQDRGKLFREAITEKLERLGIKVPKEPSLHHRNWERWKTAESLVKKGPLTALPPLAAHAARHEPITD